LYSPVGLDLGAEQPEEIALAILAEIQARNTGADVQSLRLRPGPIHPRSR
ncbi:MAG: XdhC family protein, partial [Myxococcaceae bacterium]